MAAAAQNRGPGMLVEPFVRPLPDVTDEIFNPERAGALRMCAEIRCRLHVPARIGAGDCRRIPFVTPRIRASVRSLRCVLPFPLMRKAFTRPFGVSTGIFQGDPGNRLI